MRNLDSEIRKVSKGLKRGDKELMKKNLEEIISLAKAEDYNLAKEIADFCEELGIKINIDNLEPNEEGLSRIPKKVKLPRKFITMLKKYLEEIEARGKEKDAKKIKNFIESTGIKLSEKSKGKVRKYKRNYENDAIKYLGKLCSSLDRLLELYSRREELFKKIEKFEKDRKIKELEKEKDNLRGYIEKDMLGRESSYKRLKELEKEIKNHEIANAVYSAYKLLGEINIELIQKFNDKNFISEIRNRCLTKWEKECFEDIKKLRKNYDFISGLHEEELRKLFEYAKLKAKTEEYKKKIKINFSELNKYSEYAGKMRAIERLENLILEYNSIYNKISGELKDIEREIYNLESKLFLNLS
jgi:hypothetical protein